MPSRNALKNYVPNSYYHIYNRGVEKRRIFMDERDYAVFLSYFKVALSEKLDEELKEEALTEIEEARLRRLKLDKQIELLAYCMMPNHFHLLVYQHAPDAITQLMRSTMSGYVRYFNKRHKRIGSLFQGRYKASMIDNESYLWHISRYIHLNPHDWETSPYSSYHYYRDNKQLPWLKSQTILDMHKDGVSDYQKFMHEHNGYKESLLQISEQIVT